MGSPALEGLQIFASLGEATRLHAFPPLHEATNSRQPWGGDMATSFSASHEKATNSRLPWRGYTATCFSASHGGYKFFDNLGEAIIMIEHTSLKLPAKNWQRGLYL